MKLSVRTTDRLIVQVGSGVGPLTDCTIEDVEDAVAAQITAALSEPSGGITLSPDHQAVTALPVPPPPPPDPAVVAAEAQRAADAAHLLNSAIARDTQTSRDALARILGVQPLTIPLTQDALPQDITPL